MQLIKNSNSYYITENGEVFRQTAGGKMRQLKLNKVSSLYPTVSIKYLSVGYKRMYVHRLVAMTFIPNPENKPFVNHKNLDKEDCRLENLEWTTAKENNNHARQHGSYSKTTGENFNSLYTDAQISEVCRLLEDGRRYCDIEKITAVSRKTVSEIRRKRLWVYISKDYIFSSSRSRTHSDSTIRWVCKQIQDGKTNREILATATASLPRMFLTDLRLKKCCRDISDEYF